MRFVIAFFVVAGLWLAAGSAWNDGGLDKVRSFLFSDRLDRDAPNWGDVATKIGELSEARSGLAAEIEETAETPAK
jgi:hypothetical protein